MVHKDFTKSVRTKRNKLFKIKKEIEKAYEGKKKPVAARMGHDALFVEGMKFQWTEEGALLVNGREGVATLSRCLGRDASGFLAELINGDQLGGGGGGVGENDDEDGRVREN